MSDQVVVALVSTSGASLVAVTALVLNHRGFASIERRLERLEEDMKEFYKLLGMHDTRLARLEDRGGIK